jgi:cyclohexa-1,5-dienecarbonyl-CoA hydratase
MSAAGAGEARRPPVLLQREGRVARLTLDRPPLNILDLEMIAALDRALSELAQPSASHQKETTTQVLLLRGAGGQAFSAGVAIQDHTPDRVAAMLAGFHGAIRKLMDLDAVTVAVVEGHCLGGGMELALACDLVVASDDTRFAQPEIDLACYPPVAAALYPALLGPRRAAELVLTGRPLDAQEAAAWGLVNRVVPPAAIDEEAQRLAALLTAKSGAATALAKRALAAGRRLPFREALAEGERIYLEELAATDDMREGTAAFLAKRPPIWRHR